MPHIYIDGGNFDMFGEPYSFNLQALHTSPYFVDIYPDASVVMHASP